MARERERRIRQVVYQDAVVKNLGSLPVIAHVLRQLDVQGIIDRAVPIRDVAHLTHGEVICTMVANRLSAPQPLCHFDQWAKRWTVEEVFGAKPEHLNDDRLGRALDAIAPHLGALQGSVTWSAMQAFGVDVTEVHYDLTSLVFSGEYAEEPDEQVPGLGPRVTRGYSSRGLNEKQIQVGAVTTRDGIPIWHESLDGSAQQVSRVIHTMEALKKAARVDTFTLVGDSKLLSQANMLAACRAGVHFCAPCATSGELERAFLAIPPSEFQRLDYLSQRERSKPEVDRTVYLGAERTWDLRDPETGQTFSIRRLFVISSEEQAACRKHRARQLARAEADLLGLQKGLGKGSCKTSEQVQKKVAILLDRRRVTPYFTVTVDEAEGKPTLQWSQNAEAIAAAEALDGFYVLLTNLPASQADASEVLRIYKRQAIAERRFSDFKGPLAVRPVFLKDNARIAALVFVVYLALLVYCLIERQVRRELAAQSPDGEDTMPGFLPGKRRSRPTGRSILEAFAWWPATLVTQPAGTALAVTKPSAVQQRLLELLAVRQIC
jgi:transposase